MNKKLDHLRYFMAKSKANEDEVVEDSSPVVRKRKRKRNSSRDSFSDNQTKKPYPTGILLQNNTMQGNYADYWNKEKHVRFDQSSTPCSSSGISCYLYFHHENAIKILVVELPSLFCDKTQVNSIIFNNERMEIFTNTGARQLPNPIICTRHTHYTYTNCKLPDHRFFSILRAANC